MEEHKKIFADNSRRHWFFDFDGTLARTGEDIILAWKKSIADMGLSCPRFDEVFRIGPTLEKMAYELFDEVTPELVNELTERFKPNYDESGFPNTVPYPGIPEELSMLKRNGAKIYIVTNKRHAATQKIVKALNWDILFDGVWSFDTFPGIRYKKPELLSRLLKDLNVDPSDAVMAGDTKGDIDAGKANEVYTIGVTWGYGTRDELKEADEICELN
jgi:phosphoglycolate phosphatase